MTRASKAARKSPAQTEAWQQTSVPKLSPAITRGMGAGNPTRDAKPIPRAQVERMARQAQHGGCVEHVKVVGLEKPVCITRGQDREAVIAEARELAGVRS